MTPLDPALPLNITVPVEVVPPATMSGLKLIEDGAGNVSVNEALWEADPELAVMN